MEKIYLRILCKEDIKLTTALTQITNTESIDYISGSAIRGAFIKNYLELKGLDLDEDKIGQELFLNGSLEFRNGYKEINGKRSMPTVKELYIEKKDENLYKDGIEVSLKSSVNKNVEEEYEKFECSNYLDCFEGNVKGLDVEKIYNLHINKERKKMFRYEGIKKGQVFISEIIYEKEEDKKEILNIIKNGNFYIGGSKGSGYGKVLIEEVEIKEDEKKAIEEEMIVYLASDCIFIDEYGQVINYILEKELKESLDLEEVTLVKKECEETLIGGFNNKLGVKLP
ncbi:MAG: RAMP superfamily CRISPR-associated protein, partial [Clostridium sp.]